MTTDHRTTDERYQVNLERAHRALMDAEAALHEASRLSTQVGHVRATFAPPDDQAMLADCAGATRLVRRTLYRGFLC